MKKGYLGVMLDCSRNAVMSVAELKNFILTLKKTGYNCLQLYTEDTYEIEGEPQFGYRRGKYTKAELKEIDAFAKKNGVELKIGATHYIDQGLSAEESGLQLLSLIEAHGKAGINVLAHPTRILAARGFDEEPWFDRIIAVLKQYNMAAEVNFHQNSANPEFTRRAIEAGLKLSFGTDSHNLANFGFLQPHIWLLRKIGYNGDFADILVKP